MGSYTYSFTIGYTPENTLAGGAESPASYDALRRYFNPGLAGTNWEAVLRGLGVGDDLNLSAARILFDQLFVPTASERFLDRRTGNYGVTRPIDTGISDEVYRELATAIHTEKVTSQALWRVLEIFYGADSVRGYVETGKYEPYVLFDGATIDFCFENVTNITVEFLRDDFTVLRRATAVEVAAVITRKLQEVGSNAYAVAHYNPIDQEYGVRVYSGTRGLNSKASVVGGTAQPKLRFETPVFNPPTSFVSQIWTISMPSESVARFSCASDAIYDFSQIHVGDYVVISGPEFADVHLGEWEITDVYYTPGAQWFEVSNPDGVLQNNILQEEFDSVWVFRPTVKTLNDNIAQAVVVSNNGSLEIKIPATTTVVNRSEGYAGYVPEYAEHDIVSAVRTPDGTVTVTTPVSHGVLAGQSVIIQDTTPYGVPGYVAGSPADATYDGNGVSTGASDACFLTRITTDTAYAGVPGAVGRFLDGQTLLLSGETYSVTGTRATNGYNYLHITTGTTSETDGSIGYDYEWRRVDNSLPLSGGSAVLMTEDRGTYGKITVVSGTPGVWNDYSATNENVYTKSWLVGQTDAPGHIYIDAPVTKNVSNAYGAASEMTDASHPGWVFASGGYLVRNLAHTSADMYDPIAGTWTEAAGMGTPRMQHTQHTLDDGKILVVGGHLPCQRYASTANTQHRWDFTETEPTATFTDSIGGIVLNRSGNDRSPGKIGHGVKLTAPLVATGVDAGLNSLLLGAWTIEGWATGGRGCIFSHGGYTALEADNILAQLAITGGDVFYWKWQNGAGIDCSVGQTTTRWTTVMPVRDTAGHEPVYYHLALTKTLSGGLYDVSLYVNGVVVQTWTGNALPSGGTTGVWHFGQDPDAIHVPYTGRISGWRIHDTGMTANQIWQIYKTEQGVSHDSAYDKTGQPVGNATNTSEIYDPATDTWSYTGTMGYARYGHGGVTLPDGRVLAIGGIGYRSTAPHDVGANSRTLELKSCEMFDPVLRMWRRINDMSVARAYPGVVLSTTQNRVWVSGGYTSDTVEYLDLASMKWHLSTAKLLTSRPESVASLGSDGKTVVIAGGYGAGTYDSVYTSLINHILVPASDTVKTSGIHGIGRVESVESATVFTLSSHDSEYGICTAGNYMVMAAPTSDIAGPYVLDAGCPPVTGIEGQLAAPIAANKAYSVITLSGTQAAAFPDASGYLAFGFGSDVYEGPVRYHERLSNTELRIDAGYKFTNRLATGTTVTWLASKSPLLDLPRETGSFWITNSPAGRDAAVQTIRDIVGAGIPTVIDVVYPGDRGLGNEGGPDHGVAKLTDAVPVWANHIDAEVSDAREE